MKFYAVVGLVAASNALSSHMELVEKALSMAGSREQAHILLQSALATFGRGGDNEMEAHSQTVAVPIDEKKALTLKVSPTYS